MQTDSHTDDNTHLPTTDIMTAILLKKKSIRTTPYVTHWQTSEKHNIDRQSDGWTDRDRWQRGEPCIRQHCEIEKVVYHFANFMSEAHTCMLIKSDPVYNSVTFVNNSTMCWCCILQSAQM